MTLFDTFYNKLIKENYNLLVQQVQQFLVQNYNEDYDENVDWKGFVDNQQLGDCQYIAPLVARTFPQFKSIFISIENDETFTDEEGEYNKTPHHCNIINGMYLDFSKGTLQNSIEWTDMYSPFIDGDEWRYPDLNISN